MHRHILTQSLVRELLRYYPTSGRFIWRARDRKYFKSPHDHAVWNTRFAGQETGSALHSKGYRLISIFHRLYRAHRIAWLYMHGYLPKELDHINQSPDDNRIVNLREVSHKQNIRNARMYRHNTSGVNGVYWDNNRNKWYAQIQNNGKAIHLGRFSNIEEAAKARKSAERQLGYSPLHGTK